MTDYDEYYKKYVQEFLDLVDSLKIKKPVKDSEGQPCLRPRGKRGEVMEVYAHGPGEAAMSVMGKTQNHSKTINKHIRLMVKCITKLDIHPDEIDNSSKVPRAKPFDSKLKKKVNDSGIRISQWGDSECTIVFSHEHLKVVAMNFRLCRKRKPTSPPLIVGEITNQKRFVKTVRKRWKKSDLD